MIVVSVNSGLGNQMFQFAYGYCQSKIFKTYFLVDKSSSFVLSKYFKLNFWTRLQFSNNKFVIKIIRRKIKYIKNRDCKDFTDCNVSINQFSITNHSYYVGYFQSISFFEREEIRIKKLYKIKNKYVYDFQAAYGAEFRRRKTLVIHIRRTDYLTHGIDMDLGIDDLSLPLNYYDKCIDAIDDLASYRIFVIGDDIEFIQKNFSNLPNVSFEHNESIVDFQLLMNADVAIISNSTFAWWAVYLNEKLHKRVYAPKCFLGFHINKEFPAGISYKLAYEWINPL